MDVSEATDPNKKAIWCLAEEQDIFCVAITPETKLTIDDVTGEVIGLSGTRYQNCNPDCPIGRRAVANSIKPRKK